MNRKLILLCLVIVLVFSSISSVVFAAEEGAMSNILNTFERIFGFIPKTLEKLWGEDASAVFLAKFIIWVLLYSALHYGLGFVFKEHRGPKIAVSFAIATMSTAVIPAKILINMYMTYTVVGSVLILAIPFLFGWYLIGKLPKEKEYNYIRVFIYILLIFVLFSIRGSISTLAEKGADKIGGLDTFDSLLSLFMLVCIIGIITNLFRGVTGRDAGSEHLELGAGAGRAWNWLTRTEEEETGQEENILRREAAETRRAQRDTSSLRRNLEAEGAPAAVIREVSDIQTKLVDFGRRVVVLYQEARVMQGVRNRIHKEETVGENAKNSDLQQLRAIKTREQKEFRELELDIDRSEQQAKVAETELLTIIGEIGQLEKQGLKADELTEIKKLLAVMQRQMELIVKVMIRQEKQAKAEKKKT